jgi:hypothetical protein
VSRRVEGVHLLVAWFVEWIRVRAVREGVLSVVGVGRRASEGRRTRRPVTAWLQSGVGGMLGGSAGGETAHLLGGWFGERAALDLGVLEDQRHRLG